MSVPDIWCCFLLWCSSVDDDAVSLSVFARLLLLPIIFDLCLLLQVPEKKLKIVMADKELYKVCAVEVKRQIWQDNQALFGDEVSPLLKQYIVEKEAALFSSDVSVLHSFFSPSPKTRRQGEVRLPSEPQHPDPEASPAE